ELRLRLQQLGLRLIEGRLVRPRIDLEQQVSGVHYGAFRVVLTHEVPGDAGADRRGDVADERADVLDGYRHVPLDHGLDLDDGRWRRGGRPGGIAAAAGAGRDYGDQQNRERR